MASLFSSIGQSIKGTARAAAFEMAGRDLMTAYGMASSLGSAVTSTVKDINDSIKKTIEERKKVAENTDDLAQATNEQTTVVSKLRDTLDEINDTNKKIKRQEKIIADREKFAEIERKMEAKASISSVLSAGAEKGLGALNSPVVKFLLALTAGAIAWNTLLTPEQQQDIKNKSIAFLEGLFGVDMGAFERGVNSVATGLAAAAAALFFLARVSAKIGPGGAGVPSTTKTPPTTRGPTGTPGTTVPKTVPGQTPTPSPGTGTTVPKGTPTTPPSATRPTSVPDITDGMRAYSQRIGSPYTFDPRLNQGRGGWRNIETGRIAAASAVPDGVKSRLIAKAGELAAQQGGLIVGKKIPVLGAIIGAGEAAFRGWLGDYEGAAIAAGSGAASIIPGPGTAGSIALDVANLSRDLFAIFHPENKYPTLRNVDPDDPTYVNINNDEFASSLYNAVTEAAVNALQRNQVEAQDTFSGMTAGQFAQMTPEQRLTAASGSLFGQNLQARLNQGLITEDDYSSALANYTEQITARAMRGINQTGRGGANARSRSMTSISNQVNQTINFEDNNTIGSGSTTDPSDFYNQPWSMPIMP